MPLEGLLPKHELFGERAATGDHPVVLHSLPLSVDAQGSEIAVGTVMKRVNILEAKASPGAGNSGITAAAVDEDTFASAVNSLPGTYTFSYTTAWALFGETVTIADYGLTLTGSASSGDSVIVTLSIAGVAYEPLLSTDSSAVPVAVVDAPCPADKAAVLCVVHGGVKARLLQTGDEKAVTADHIADLTEHGIYSY